MIYGILGANFISSSIIFEYLSEVHILFLALASLRWSRKIHEMR